VFPFLGVSNWRELNDRGMNFIPGLDTRNAVETAPLPGTLIFGQDSPGAAL
jgi:hypothetical protein